MTRLRAAAHPSLVLFVCLFASQSALLVLSPILPEVAREFGVSTATAGQLRALSGLTGGTTAILLAVLPWRPGLRDILLAGAALITLGSAASAAAPSFATLAIAQAGLGAGIGALVSAGIAAAGQWPQPAARPHVLAWTIAGMPAAWIAGMPVVGLVVQAGWRATWLAVPMVAGLAALALVWLRPADPRSCRSGDAAAAWRRPEVARFAAGELLANAAWAGVLTYAGALMLGSYPVSASLVAFGFALTAAAMVPGTFTARGHAARATPALLNAFTAFQAAAVIALGAVRPAPAVTLTLLALMSFVNGWRSMLASALGMDSAPEDKLAVMAMRAAANQFGYLLGAAAGGLALALGGFPALGLAYAAMFALAIAIHAFPALRRWPTPAPARAPH